MLGMLNVLIERDFIVESEQRGRSPVEHDRVFSFKHVLIWGRSVQQCATYTPLTGACSAGNLAEKQLAGHPELFAELLPPYHYQQALATSFGGTSTGRHRCSQKQYHHGSVINFEHLTRSELRNRASSITTIYGN